MGVHVEDPVPAREESFFKNEHENAPTNGDSTTTV